MATTTKVQDMAETDLENQIAELREQLTTISRSLSEQGYELFENGGSAFDSMRRSTRRAARFVGEEAQLVTEKARENPMTAVAIVSAVAGLGLLAGLSAYRR
ncbi:hypothetical protein [Phyllobacterium endophyticum]|uniref:DUF883 domain-containing protein n=1 Tax=Phyllobacterium endophyticum TaxID=1149773 RepID=A0A2P7AVN3_9HYPH|nr:hypothetical protein [Phyllobacterium endophyticum]MBB3234841.1 ElaB/YqjD/DUF883 family membrane-anchored ribosome-binding protein [Phyllobacterium endophyticum]PSH58269.1 hypothetical protein CU100_11655 [Phyllobacterium endophyticum]TYR38951.1 hypothetical protein FY050_23590 [Phyllobacterium endophyticum]